MAQYSQNLYTVDAGNDFSAGLAGLSNTLGNIRQAKIQEAEQQRIQEREDRAQQRFQEVQSAAQQAFASQNPDEVAKISIKYPEITEMLRQTTGLQDDMKNKEALSFTRALATASPESRPALYENRINSIRERGGDPSHTIQSYEDYKLDPNSELRDVTSFWAGIDPKGYGAYSDEQKAAAKAQLEKDKAAREEAQFNRAEAGRNRRAYARAAQTAGGSAADKLTANRKDFNYYQELKQSDPTAATEFGRQAGFVSKEGRELSPQVQKRLSTSIDDAVAAENNVGKFNNLANEVERSDLKGGVMSSFSEKLKDITGEQDANTNLRKEYNAIKASQIVNNLPPGAASDADVALAMSGYPSDRANKAQIASFLRGLSKVQKLNSEFNNFKADYISDTGSERGMLQAWKKGGAGSPQGATKTPPASQQPAAPSVTTQAQFDALPSGAVYLEDGVQYRKP